MAEKFPLGENTGYVLTPNNSLSCEQYGFILPVDNPEWKNLVNSVINSPEKTQVFQNWFQIFSSQFLGNVYTC